MHTRNPILTRLYHLKQLDKEITAYGTWHERAIDATYTKKYLITFLPEDERPATIEEMDAFIAHVKSENLNFKEIMAKAKANKRFDLKYISQAARN